MGNELPWIDARADATTELRVRAALLAWWRATRVLCRALHAWARESPRGFAVRAERDEHRLRCDLDKARLRIRL
jgi:hypothetical protein